MKAQKKQKPSREVVAAIKAFGRAFNGLSDATVQIHRAFAADSTPLDQFTRELHERVLGALPTLANARQALWKLSEPLR